MPTLVARKASIHPAPLSASLDAYLAGYGGMVGIAALTPPYALFDEGRARLVGSGEHHRDRHIDRSIRQIAGADRGGGLALNLIQRAGFRFSLFGTLKNKECVGWGERSDAHPGYPQSFNPSRAAFSLRSMFSSPDMAGWWASLRSPHPTRYSMRDGLGWSGAVSIIVIAMLIVPYARLLVLIVVGGWPSTSSSVPVSASASSEH